MRQIYQKKPLTQPKKFLIFQNLYNRNFFKIKDKPKKIIIESKSLFKQISYVLHKFLGFTVIENSCDVLNNFFDKTFSSINLVLSVLFLIIKSQNNPFLG